MRLGAGFCAALVLVAPSAQAQGRPVPARLLPPSWQPPATVSTDSGRSAPTWIPPIASALIPGAGQLMRGEDRGAIYFITEAFLLQRFLSLRTDAHREEDRYRELALKIARAPFGPNARDTVFEYFEQMGKFVESGPFDTDPGPNLVPPTEEAWYNGAIWALARRTYFSGTSTPPDTSITYRSALAFYRSRAIGPNYQWSWQNASVEQDLFRETIRDGDETFRRATQQLGLLLANHFLSAVDAFVSHRLSRRGRAVKLDHQIWFPGAANGAELQIKVGVGF